METPGRELVTILEKDVKKVALSAMRSYYRFRVKAGTPELSSDVKGAGGIIADGYYSFPQEDGKWFVATFEATGIDSKDEVYYKREKELLTWDSIAFSCFTTALLFSVSHILKFGWVIQFKVIGTISWLILALASFFLFYFFSFAKWRRYRYIYAIEQFKQYHADEQWVVISEDVFDDSRNKAFQELRKQCIRYGFGLIQVDNYRQARMVVTPARHEVFENQRQAIRFFSKKQLERLKFGSALLKAQWKKITAAIPERMRAYDPRYLFRFKRSYQNQWVTIGISVLTLSGIIFREVQQLPERHLGQRAYAREVVAAEKSYGPESSLSIEPFDTLYIRPYDTTGMPYLAFLESERMRTQRIDQWNSGLLIGMFGEALITYDCERLYNLKAPKYIVQEGIYPDFETASARMSQLIRKGLEINCLWLGCFNKSKDNSYALYFGLLQESRLDAQKLAKNYARRLKSAQTNANISIRMLAKR